MITITLISCSLFEIHIGLASVKPANNWIFRIYKNIYGIFFLNFIHWNNMEKIDALTLFETSVKETVTFIHYDVSLYRRIFSIRLFHLQFIHPLY